MRKTDTIDFGDEYDEFLAVKNPRVLAIELMAGKNLWLIKVRWIYSLFILLFFSTRNAISEVPGLPYRTMCLILGLSVLGNVIFLSTLRRGQKYPSEEHDYRLYNSMGSLQLDFDLVVLSLLVFFSGGFGSPMLVLFIFYIVLATFLVDNKKAIRNTITAIFLVTTIFFSGEGLTASGEQLSGMIVFNIILLFAFFISAYLSQNIRDNEKKIRALLQKTREMSVTDGLTGLYNQTHFFLLFRLELEKSKRYNHPISLVMFDVDHFKNYNDNNGHMRGSEALARVGELMGQVFRESDILAKYGGDEFVIILPHTDKNGALLAAERLRERIADEPFEGEHLQPLRRITLSLGIAGYPDHGDSVEVLLEKADRALYFAKENGRNRAVVHNPDMDGNEPL